VSYQLRFTEEAFEDLKWLYAFTAENDPASAEKAFEIIGKAWGIIETFPFSCRKAESTNPFLRELVIPFGVAGYVALFEIESNQVVTVLAVRHQREEDYH